MKALRSPWVSGALVAIAIAVIVYQFKPMWDRRQVARRPAPATTPAAATDRTTSKPAPATRPALVSRQSPETRSLGPQKIDRALIASRIGEWIDSPRRDPFLFTTRQSTPAASEPEAPSPIQQWTLKSIWRQTSERRAVINNGIYKEGDEIEGYRLERIDSDEVWFRGSNRVESLTFDYRKPPVVVPATTGTNAPPAYPRRDQKLERFLLAPQRK